MSKHELTPEVAARVQGLKPCPFCLSPLVEATTFRTRDSAHMVHEANGCIGSSFVLVVKADSPEAREREAMWNKPLRLDGWEWGKLLSYVEATYLTYAGHDAGAGLFPEEKVTMQRWSDLTDKLNAIKP